MAGKWNVLLLRFVRDGQEGIARKFGIHFDQISAPGFEPTHSFTTLFRRSDCKKIRTQGLRASIEEWRCAKDAWSKMGTCCCLVAQAMELRQSHGRARVSNTKFTVGDERGKHANQSFRKN